MSTPRHHNRIHLHTTVLLGLIATQLLQAQSGPCDNFAAQPSATTTDCQNRPPGTLCLGYPDGYKWLVEANGLFGGPTETHFCGTIDISNGWRATGFPPYINPPIFEYHHIRGTNLVKIVPLGCSAPVGSEPQWEQIVGWGRCPPVGKKKPAWGRFGDREVLEFNSGEKLELRCASAPGAIPSFILSYTPVGSDRAEWVSFCPFEGGCNTAWFLHSGDTNPMDGRPDCLIRVKATSRDYSTNDDPHPLSVADGITSRLDWVNFVFDTNTQNVFKEVVKYGYKLGPPVPMEACDLIPGLFEDLADKSYFPADPPVGPQTTDLLSGLAQNILAGEAMREDRIEICDFDRDGDCDADDRLVLSDAMGLCRGNAGYFSGADVDGDGCITAVDDAYLFVNDEDGDGVPDASDNCRTVPDAAQPDADADGRGDACDNCPLAANAGQTDTDLDGSGDACDDDDDGDAVPDASDNCPTSSNPSLLDRDSDGEGDACDLDDGLIVLELTSAETLRWQEESGFDSWNCYRGDLDVLRTTGVYTQTGGLAAKVCGQQLSSLDDTTTILGGDAVFYLISGVSNGIEGTLGGDSAGLPRPNTSPCP